MFEHTCWYTGNDCSLTARSTSRLSFCPLHTNSWCWGSYQPSKWDLLGRIPVKMIWGWLSYYRLHIWSLRLTHLLKTHGWKVEQFPPRHSPLLCCHRLQYLPRVEPGIVHCHLEHTPRSQRDPRAHLTVLGVRSQCPCPLWGDDRTPSAAVSENPSKALLTVTWLFCTHCMKEHLTSPWPFTLKLPHGSLHNSFWYLVSVTSWYISHNFPFNVL